MTQHQPAGTLCTVPARTVKKYKKHIRFFKQKKDDENDKFDDETTSDRKAPRRNCWQPLALFSLVDIDWSALRVALRF